MYLQSSSCNSQFKRTCLHSSAEIKSERFLKIILLDAVFIFELFLKNNEYSVHPTKTSTCYCMATFPPFLDLSCNYFENYGKSKTLPDETKHFTDLVRYFLSSKHPTLESPDRKQRKQHFTDRVRDCLPFMHRKPEPPIKNPYSATMLHQAGIKFKPNLQAECLLDIRAWNENNFNFPIQL
ncbi:hypothetical protein OIU78_015922 [Salix suchowensis]|nr:hypothetical protein OIU78_015922 [Salix suchowensis]